jgi:hypothetical protein
VHVHAFAYAYTHDSCFSCLDLYALLLSTWFACLWLGLIALVLGTLLLCMWLRDVEFASIACLPYLCLGLDAVFSLACFASWMIAILCWMSFFCRFVASAHVWGKHGFDLSSLLSFHRIYCCHLDIMALCLVLKYPCKLLALSWELSCLVGSSFRKVLELVSCCFLL